MQLDVPDLDAVSDDQEEVEWTDERLEGLFQNVDKSSFYNATLLTHEQRDNLDREWQEYLKQESRIQNEDPLVIPDEGPLCLEDDESNSFEDERPELEEIIPNYSEWAEEKAFGDPEFLAELHAKPPYAYRPDWNRHYFGAGHTEIAAQEHGFDEALFDQMKRLRSSLAQSAGKPAYGKCPCDR